MSTANSIQKLQEVFNQALKMVFGHGGQGHVWVDGISQPMRRGVRVLADVVGLATTPNHDQLHIRTRLPEPGHKLIKVAPGHISDSTNSVAATQGAILSASSKAIWIGEPFQILSTSSEHHSTNV